MGNKLSSDYEQILARIEEKIYQTEINIAEANLRQRKTTALLTTYSILVYLVWLFSFFMMVWPNTPPETRILDKIQQLSPLVLIPFCIYSIRWIVRAYYRRHVTYQEQKLDALKKSRKQKIEELKQKANYYTAKNLIDRYASDDENPSELDQSPRQRQRSNIENNFAGEHGHESPKQIVDANYAINYSLSNPAPQNLNTTFPLQNQIARTWVDRVLDLIVGEESPGTRFALICENCFNHNGLALPEELDSLQYVCPKCSHLNVKKKSLPNSKNSDENSTVKQRIKTTEKQEQKESIE